VALMPCEGEVWEIRPSYVSPGVWMYRRRGDEFWRYPPNFWRMNPSPPRAIRPQSIAREQYERAWTDKQRLNR
jgi:hypothetical protein